MSCRIIGGSLVAIGLSCAIGGLIQMGEPGPKFSAKVAFALSLLCGAASFGLYLLSYIISLMATLHERLDAIEKTSRMSEGNSQSPFGPKKSDRHLGSLLY